uniref:Peptidase S1 domain-containing protein n=1 Tax=Pogona vitticeps TaxID=103695 RepID=A0ABM5FQ29_9SAUR
MELLLGLCALFQLFIVSSGLCGFRHLLPKLAEAVPKKGATVEAPWLVNIYGNGQRCQGVVLSSWWVLTAANCFLSMSPSHVELTGAHGSINTQSVSQFMPHKGFSTWDTEPNNDLGLLLLSQPLDLRTKDMWPACVPKEEKADNTQEECRIFERSQDESTLKEIEVDALMTSKCVKRWPGTTEKMNLCVARKNSDQTDCRVPIGSPVICHNPDNKHWEVMGMVSRSLRKCTAPILASKVLTHLEWLKKEKAVEDPLNPRLDDNNQSSAPEEEELSPTAGQAVTFPTGLIYKPRSQEPSAALEVPVSLPDAEPTPVHPRKATKPSSTANNVILVASPSIQRSSHIAPTRTKTSRRKTSASVPSTSEQPSVVQSTETQQSSPVVSSTAEETSVAPTTVGKSTAEQQTSAVASSTTNQTPTTSTTLQTSTTTQQTSTTEQQPSTTQQPSTVSSTTKQTTAGPTTKRPPQTSPTFRPPHIIIIPATTPKPLPPPDHVHYIVVDPQFPKNKREESPSPDPSVALRGPSSMEVSFIPHFGLPVQVKLHQCEMGLAWNSNSHTYQLNKMAVLIDRKIGCGLRPGFVPKCPSCSEAEMGEFPWIVSLRLSIQHFCAGSILNPWWILTTANCANLIKNSETLALVQAGQVDASKASYSVQIRQALTHPGSLEQQDLHNLGLLELEEPLEFGPLVGPICLLDKADTMANFRDCWLPGWTMLDGGPTVLLKHHLDILNISKCSQLGDQLPNATFCINAQVGQEGVCKGDVGSPLICSDPKGGAWLQLGVLSSFDEACSHPYVFSSLPFYLPWLKRATKAAGHRYNLFVPWERLGAANNLRLLRQPESMIAQISAQLSMPWQVLIATCENQSCGGSILNRYWVLTTAQCVREADPGSTAVFVGLTHPKGYVKGIPVAGIYPYENGSSQYSLSDDYSLALLLLQKPITFGKHITRMTFTPKESWDSCKVMGLQMLQPGEVRFNPSAYQVKVLIPSDCAKEHPGVNPGVYCVVRDNSSYLPAGAVGEGAALLCHLETKSTKWSQVGLVSEPFPGSQTVVLSSSIASYVDWIEKTSKQAKHLFVMPHTSAARKPSSWLLLLLLSLFGGAELG